MPVTAKFSREFYDKFGHDAVDELVDFLNRLDSGYRSELRELNEHNFARFDAKLEQRAAELEAKIDSRAAELEARIDTRAAQLEAKLDTRTAELDARIDRLASEFGAKLDTRTAHLSRTIEERIGQAERRLLRWTFAFWVPTMLAIVSLVVGIFLKR